MSGVFDASATEASGTPASPNEIDKICVTLGWTSLGSGLSPFFSSAASAQALVGYGDAVDTLCQGIEQRQNGSNGVKYAGQVYSMAASIAGTYGAVNVAGVTGTAIVAVDPTVIPYGTYEAQIRAANTFTIGTAGGMIQWSLDGGRTFSNSISIGIADSYTIASGNVKFTFNPASVDVTAKNTLVNAEFTSFNAHVALVTGAVHTNADTVDQVSAGSFPSATNTATANARMGALIAAAKLHVVKGTGGTPATHINAAGDTVALASLNAIPVITDDETCLAAAVAFKTIMNLHFAGTTWHTIADATNVIATAAPSPGTLAAGDIAKVRTTGPTPSAADIDAAFVALSVATGNVGIVACEFPMTAALAAHVTTGLNLMQSKRGKRPVCLARTRIPDFENAETETAWAASIIADFVNFYDSRMVIDASYGLITDASTTRQYYRSGFAQLVADTLRVERFEMPSVPADPVGVGMPNFTLVNAAGALVGHDEGAGGVITGLSNEALGNRFCSVMRLPDSTAPEAVYRTVPWTMFAPTDRIKNLPTRRVVNAIERTVITISIRQLGRALGYIKADPNTPGSQPTLTPVAQRAIQSVIFQALSTAFSKDIQNSTDANILTGLVQIDPVVQVTGGNLLTVSVTTAPRVLGYLLKLINTISVQQ